MGGWGGGAGDGRVGGQVELPLAVGAVLVLRGTGDGRGKVGAGVLWGGQYTAAAPCGSPPGAASFMHVHHRECELCIVANHTYTIWRRPDPARPAAPSLPSPPAGIDAAFPVMVAPMAMHGMAHPGKEPATARGAAAAGVPFVSGRAAEGPGLGSACLGAKMLGGGQQTGAGGIGRVRRFGCFSCSVCCAGQWGPGGGAVCSASNCCA